MTLLLDVLRLACLAALLLAALGAATLVAFTFYMEPAVRRHYRLSKAFPQPKGLPILGNLLQIVKPRDELFKVLRDYTRQAGHRYVLRIFGMSFFHIAEPESIKVVLSSSKNISKGQLYDFLQPWLGQGLLTSQGALWHSRRKLLTPAFHFRILDQFAEHLQQHAVGLVDELEGARLTAKQVPVDVAPIISRATLRAIMMTAMGNVNFQTVADSSGVTSEKSYFHAVHSVGTAVVMRITRPWLWLEPLFRLSSLSTIFRRQLAILHSFTSKVIAERKESLFSGGDTPANDDAADDAYGSRKKSRPRPFLDVLLNAQRDGADLSDQDIREEVDTFMFEGHDTTSVALSWALEQLGRQPAVQDALAAELLDAADDTWQTVSGLPYLDRVLKECLRLRPSVPIISRRLDQDAVLHDGKILPAHSLVDVLIYDLHRHPDYFPDPERFDPDRFMPEAERARHPFAYIPFSAGLRNCIGKRFAVMEMKLLLAAVVRRFHIRSAMTEQADDDMFSADLVLRPRVGGGVLLHLTPRQS